MSAAPFMTAAEADFLASHLRPDDIVLEWGTGTSTLWFSEQVRHVVTIEHQPEWIAWLVARPIPRNVTAVIALPTRQFLDDDGDGDDETFARYIGAYRLAVAPDVVLIDGRARVACAQAIVDLVAETSDDPRAIFVHDMDRAEYAPIERILKPVDRVGALGRFEVR